MFPTTQVPLKMDSSFLAEFPSHFTLLVLYYLYMETKYFDSKSKPICTLCGKPIKLSYTKWLWRIKERGTKVFFCSSAHQYAYYKVAYKGRKFHKRKKNPSFFHTCVNCGKKVYRPNSRIIPERNIFCSIGCLSLWKLAHKAPPRPYFPHPIIPLPLFEFDCATCGKHTIKNRVQSAYYRLNVRRGRTTFYCSPLCNPIIRNSTGMKGKHHSLATREKMRITHLHGRKPTIFTGRKLVKRIRHCHFYKVWKNQVRTFANGICQDCGKPTSILHAHHKIPLEDIIAKSGLTDYWSLVNYKPLWDIKIGKAVCEKCHDKYHDIIRK